MSVTCVSSRLLSTAIQECGLYQSRSLIVEAASIAAFGLSAVELVTAVALSVLTSPLAWANGQVCLEYWEKYISSCLFTHIWALGTAASFNLIFTNRWHDEDSARTGMSTGNIEAVSLKCGLIFGVFVSAISLQVGMALYFGGMTLQSFFSTPVVVRQEPAIRRHIQYQMINTAENWCREYLFGPNSSLTGLTQQAIREGDPSSFSFIAAHAIYYYAVVKKNDDIPNWLAGDSQRFITDLRQFVSACLKQENTLRFNLRNVGYRGESDDQIKQNWARAVRYIRAQPDALKCLENLVPKDLDLFNSDTRGWPSELEWLFQRIKTKSHSNTQLNPGGLMEGLSRALRV